MAKFDYARTAATATRMISRFGQPGAVVRDTATGPAWEPNLVPVEHPCTLCVMDYSSREVDGAIIRMGDRNVYVSIDGLSIVPTVSDKLLIQGELWSIANVKHTAPAGIETYYECQIRR